jgi:4-amino-4-deoxy-L-arabinose transferase-like glycosyltransferase
MTATTHLTGALGTFPGAAVLGRVRAWFVAHRRDLAWVAPIIAVAAVVSFVNIAGSPQRIDDEGTYTAQAYAIVQLGELAHYTYWYDHPPLGWIQIALYAVATGAFSRWDVAVLAGREASIVWSLVAAILLWVLARRVGLSRPAASVAVVLFTLSPLALQFHRTVYLDNFALPWLLLAFVLATERRNQLAAFTGAAVAFGIAVLTKETFLLALPFLVWVIVRSADRATRRYTLSVAASTLVLIGGSYLLLAAVKGELLSGAGRVSLMDGILFQLGTRESSGSLADPASFMSRTLGMWWQLDAALLIAALAAAVGGLFLKRLRPYAVMVLALTAFMFRPGGYLPVPYVIMLIPFGVVLVAGVADVAVARLRRRRGIARTVVAGIVVVAAAAGAVVATPAWAGQLRGFLAADLDRPARDATAWLEANADRQQRLIVDDSMWVDLVEAGWDRENVVWYYKLDTDPAVAGQSPNGWRDSDFIITTDSMRTSPGQFPQVSGAIDNSVPVATFGEGAQAVEVRKIMPDGLDAAATTQQAVVARQADLGAQLAQNPAVQLSDAARQKLADGLVDERIIAMLGALAVDRSVSVDGFPIVEGEQDGIARQVEISGIDGAPPGDLSATLAALGPSYVPEEVTDDADHALLTYALLTPAE